MALTGSSAYKTSLSALILYLLLPQWDPVSWNWRPPTTVPQFYSCCCLPPSHSLLHLCNGSQVFASTTPGSQPYSLHPSPHHGPCVKKTPLGGLPFFSRLAVFFPFLNSQSTSISSSLITCVTDCVIFSTYLLPSQPCPTLRLLPGHTGHFLSPTEREREWLAASLQVALRSSTWGGRATNVSQEGLLLLPDSRNVNSMEQKCSWLRNDSSRQDLWGATECLWW